MPEATDPATPPVTDEGETNEQKATREAEERRLNAAKEQVKGWTTEAISDYFKANPPGASSTTSTTSKTPAKRKSIIETIFGL